MKVRVTGPGVASEAVTDVKGCAVFEVVPSANGTNYEVALLGPADSAIYVNPAGESQPSVTAHYLRPGDSRTVTFEDYEQAASLTVTVDATLDPTATSAAIGPHSGGAGNIREVLLVDGKAEFDLLSPGIYTVWAGASTPVSVTLGPGEHGEVSIP
jgi:hypothetical protein